MKSLRVLDVTLRDGGCVNDFNFGKPYMDKILAALEESNVDIIELGYIDEQKGSLSERTQYCNDRVISKSILHKKKRNVTYVAMIDYGKFDIDNLHERTEDSIDGIRMAFHKRNQQDMVLAGKKVMEKGYEFFIQPMVTLRYSDVELLELIDLVNRQLPEASGFYIVDSFGEMRPNDMGRMLNLVDHNLLPSMSLGFHSHNNLQLSYSNAMEILNFSTARDVLLDCSIMGMGKGAGNLNTELLMEHLNLFYGKEYKIAPLLEVMDKVINQLHTEFYWGYAPEYYLSSSNHCTPSYASYFYGKHMLPIDQVSELLNLIDENKKISFDKQYAEQLYREYNEKKSVNDEDDVEELCNELNGRSVLLIATGKSLGNVLPEIQKLINDGDYVVIGLNSTLDLKYDYLLTTRREVYDDAILEGCNIIASSAISKGGRGNVKILDYKKWIIVDEKTHDSSIVLAFNLFFKCKVKEVLLAGFDGFSSNMNENYYDPMLRRPITEKQARQKNSWNKKFIQSVREKGIKIKFFTPSMYE